ncbi:MAG: transglycosylase domain-containing protein [Elusimicrobia bacterium]|nr:transglycosylase domain-containing protein [Elusimicrobiota bacterium]
MTRRKAAALLAFAAVAAVAAAGPSPPAPPLKDPAGYPQAVYDREGGLLRLTTAPDGRYRLWRPLGALGPELVRATLAREDRRFRLHPGVDPFGLVRAVWSTYVLGRRAGGSTVTMQLARLRGRLRTRRPAGKLRQMLAALTLELLYPKDDILEAYLNSAPYGGGIEGAAAASLIYFGKEPGNLVAAEAEALAALPQSPSRRGPLLAGRADSRGARDLPFRAPHAVDALLGADGERSPVIVSTIDPGLQALLERQLRDYVAFRRAEGIHNAAALLVDRRGMEVLAAVGSADYLDARISGQVDGTRAPRSPGSALKPLVYARAFEQGLVHPATVLNDAPTRFGDFSPENFDGSYQGPVSAREALVRSRNVPVIGLAARISEPDLYDILRRAGTSLPFPREHYGLALALGDAEVTMEDLARLYAMLADGGVVRPLRRRLDAPPGDGRRLLGPEACWLTMDILKEVPRPGQSFRSRWTRDAVPVYWKTGTSWAFRDAWAVGVMGRFVLVVWVGDFSGAGNPAFVGTQAAGPLFFRVMDALRQRLESGDRVEAVRPERVSRLRVCPVSGRLPGADCPRTVAAWFIAGVSPIETCALHRRVAGRVYEFWPSDLARILRAAGLPRLSPPGTVEGAPPRITSPTGAGAYARPLSGAGAEPLPLTAVADAGAAALYWFAGERFLGRAKPGETLYWDPSPGTTLVRVVDDRGRSDAQTVAVGAAP